MSPATERAVQAWAGNVLRVARAKKGLSQRDRRRRRCTTEHDRQARVRTTPTHPPDVGKILASVGLALTTRVEPYDDHDDVLWAGDQERSAEQRAESRPNKNGCSSAVAAEFQPEEILAVLIATT